jgi:signal transduction histidine kinase
MVWHPSWSVESSVPLRLRLLRWGQLAFLLIGVWSGLRPNALAAEASATGGGLKATAADGDSNLTNLLGSWIWTDKTLDRQTCQFWREFEIPEAAQVTHARLVMTVDNEFTVFLDGRELGRGAEWRELFDYDITLLMSAGRHVLAVKAYNSSSFAGMVFGLRILLGGGKLIEVKSDPSWRIVPEGAKGWEKKAKAPKTWSEATVIAPFGSVPWQEVPVRINLMPTLQPIKVLFWQTGWFQITLLSISGVVILISLRLLAQLALHRKEQWLLRQERARIARDIHDDIGSRITQLVLHGEVMQSERPADAQTRFQLDRICEEARGVLSTMDEILWAVNPKRDTFEDFASFVCGYAEEFLKPTGILCLFDADPAVSDVVLNLPVKRALLMVLKEALNNAVKHSAATEVVLRIRWQSQKLIMVISDNGKGFDQSSAGAGRNGLANMAQRVGELGGTCVISSAPGKGCRTEFSIPLKQTGWSAWTWLARFLKQFRLPRNQTAKPQPGETAEVHDPTR